MLNYAEQRKQGNNGRKTTHVNRGNFLLALTIPRFRIEWGILEYVGRNVAMTKNSTTNDNWGQLLSDFGIEDKTPDEPVAPAETVESLDREAEVTDDLSKPRDKKSIFSRFPKINFFGAPPEVSLDSVSLGGKTFTDNKLEKMPLSQEWTDRQEKDAVDSNTLSAVASQIDSLASGERPAKRQASSMFDDPVPESEEFRVLKDIMGSPARREETHRDDLPEETDSWRRGRGGQTPQPKEREIRGRGSRYKPPVEIDDLPESDFEPVDDEMPRTPRRGHRGSRHAGSNYRDREPIQDDVPQEEWSEVDAALQGRDESGRRGGGGRRPRYDKRRGPERTERPVYDRESSDIEESGIVAVHGDVPSWDEAIGDIIAGNIVRHKNHSGSRGRR